MVGLVVSVILQGLQMQRELELIHTLVDPVRPIYGRPVNQCEYNQHTNTLTHKL